MNSVNLRNDLVHRNVCNNGLISFLPCRVCGPGTRKVNSPLSPKQEQRATVSGGPEKTPRTLCFMNELHLRVVELCASEMYLNSDATGPYPAIVHCARRVGILYAN